jgi:uncharacterized glyoxalase superfamily protein PhnB
MAAKISPIPKGYHTLTPALMVGGAAKAIEFYKKAFGATETMRFPGPDGRIMHASLMIGDSPIMLGDEMPDMGARGPKTIGGSPVSIFLYTDNVDQVWKKAVGAGAIIVQPLVDQFWGDRAGMLDDPFGHHWWLAQHIKDPTPEELNAGAQASMAKRREMVHG